MKPTLILYNGRCPICAAEIAHYRRRAARTGAPLEFEDLHDADLGQWMLTADQAKRRLHARLPNGEMVSGLAAFTAIWRNLSGLRWLATLMGLPVLRTIAGIAYDRIAAPALYHLHRRRERLGKVAPHA